MFDERWGLNTLPQKLRQYLLDQPETTDDLHVVSVILKDGRVFEDVAISHCSLVAAVRGHSHVPFDAKDIAELRVTHRRWGFGQEANPLRRDGGTTRVVPNLGTRQRASLQFRDELPPRELARNSEMPFPSPKN